MADIINPTFNLALGIATLAKTMGVPTCDLSAVPDPKGRIDYLASKIVEQTVAGLSAELQMTYLAARPLIDGYLNQQLGKVKVSIPPAIAQQVMNRMNGGAA